MRAGEDVLDVATGTGNVALRAAAAGANVVGLDLTPELFAAAWRRMDEWGVAVDWVEGDAEELPFDDESFDAVLSVFGVQFAPRHQIVARELARVCRPGGRIGLVNWTPEGQIGELFKIMGSYLPVPAVVRRAAAAVGQRAVRARPVRGHASRARVRPRVQPLAVPVRRGVRLVHGDELRPDPEGARAPERGGALAGVPRGDPRDGGAHNEATDGSLLMHAEYMVAIGMKA